MEDTKLYFKSIDDTHCTILEDHLKDASLEGLEKITLVEAVPADGTEDHVWCTHYGEAIDKPECKKSHCGHYSSKSGRGKCIHRGNLYFHGEEIEFDVPKNLTA